MTRVTRNASRRRREEEHLPRNALLRQALVLAAQGRTHAEIAAQFGRCERTVRYWLAEAQRRRIVAFRGLTPEKMLAQTETKLLAMQAVLLQRLATAQDTSDNKGIAALVREVRGIERDRYAIREIAGFFDDVRWHHTSGDQHDDPRARAAEMLQDMILNTFAPIGRRDSFRALPKPITDENGDDDDAIL